MAKRSKSLHQQYGLDAPAVLTGGIVDAAELVPLPERFQVKQEPGAPRVRIVDTETGRSAVVPGYAYSAVRQTLTSLFGD